MIVLAIFLLSSPGDSVGWTRYDLQRDGGQTGWQVWFDGSCVHVDFMRSHEPGHSDCCCAYNFWKNYWFGDADVTPGYSGSVTLGVKPSNNAAVCIYHHRASGDIYRTWVSIDEGQGYYNFTYYKVLPQCTTEFIGPRISIDNKGNFHITLHTYGPCSYYTRCPSGSLPGTDPILIDSLMNLSTGVFADRFNTPGKVIIYWTRWTGEGSGGHAQHAQNVCYMISTDYGNSWGPKVNLTQYQSSDTMRAFCQVKAIFDQNGDPHIVFPVNYFLNQTAYYKSWNPLVSQYRI